VGSTGRRRGVEVRGNSLRIRYTLAGKEQAHTVTSNGQPLTPTPPNIAFAERLAAEIRQRIRLGTFSAAEFFPQSGADTGDGLRLGEQMQTWLDAQRLADSTRKGYESAVRFWSAAAVDGVPLGARSLRSLKVSDLLRGLATRPGLTGKTINNYTSVLREALALALADGAIPANPAEKIPRAAHQKDPPDPFAAEERAAILADLAAKAPPQVFNLVEFWFFTGLRTSEIAGLRWPACGTGEVEIREAMVRGKAKATTKTSTARVVRLNDRAAAALAAQRQHTYLAGAHVFLDPRYGTPWVEERAFRRSYWEPCLKRLGIRYRRPYQMRHTYATFMLMAGAKPAWAARQLGHSLQIFLSTYARWMESSADDAEVGRLNEALFSPASTRVAR
jgi:integrase